ncbi:hypothetical protein CPB83DRAFT_886185 [Crepidotus variabilis]|uniref:Uncharacterized protein n=1 Tax=Crepidotus variabilis TaxID=179855 RepID=A0A9P6E8M6_9AGAR|nr:hypothetical protein CPB83DRAFT_886185 [Crepidotus variabilis]
MDPMNAPVLEWYANSSLPNLPNQFTRSTGSSTAQDHVSITNSSFDCDYNFNFNGLPPTLDFFGSFQPCFEPSATHQPQPQPNIQAVSWYSNVSFSPPASPVGSTWSDSSVGSSHIGVSPILHDQSMDLPVPLNATSGGEGLPYDSQPEPALLNTQPPPKSSDGGWPSVINKALTSLSLQPTIGASSQQAASATPMPQTLPQPQDSTFPSNSLLLGPCRQTPSTSRKSRMMDPIKRQSKTTNPPPTRPRAGSGILGLCQWQTKIDPLNPLNPNSNSNPNATHHHQHHHQHLHQHQHSQCGIFLGDMTNGELLQHLKDFHAEPIPSGKKLIKCRWRGCRASRATDGVYHGSSFKRHILTRDHVRDLDPAFGLDLIEG